MKTYCGKFCSWFGRCLNQHEGECFGYQEPDDDDEYYEEDDIIERMTY